MELLVLIGSLVAVLVIAVAAGAASSRGGDSAAEVAVSTLKATPQKVTVSGQIQQHAAGGSDVQTKFFQTLIAIDEARKTGATEITRNVFDNGKLVHTELAWVNTENLDFPQLSEDEIRASVRLATRNLDTGLVSLNYSPLLGGTAEIVIRPNDEEAFMRNAGQNLFRIISPLSADHRPYLVTVVDSSGATLYAMSFMPGLGGFIGEGSVWGNEKYNNMLKIGPAETIR